MSFRNFGRNIKLTINGNELRFHTIKEGDYQDENGDKPGENTSITLPDQNPIPGDLINIGSDGRTVAVNNNIRQTYTGLVGIEPAGAGNGNKRRLVEKIVTIPDPYLTQRMFDQLYPPGTVYITVSGAQPFQNYEGITSNWEQIGQGRCLWGCENDMEINSQREPGLPNIKGYFGSNGLVPGKPNSMPDDQNEVFTPIDAVTMPDNSPIYPKWRTKGGKDRGKDADGDYLATPNKKGGV